MLKGINKIISPELLYILDKMGHGDEIVLGDGNFPGENIANKNNITIIRSDACGIPELLEAILEIFPLDTYDNNIYLMEKTKEDKDLNIEILDKYKQIISKFTDKSPVMLERYSFYEHSKKSYCIVMTGESSVYANIILKKGVVK